MDSKDEEGVVVLTKECGVEMKSKDAVGVANLAPGQMLDSTLLLYKRKRIEEVRISSIPTVAIKIVDLAVAK